MKLKVSFRESGQSFSPKFNESQAKGFNSTFGEVTIVEAKKEADFYNGEYEITPTVDAQTLPVAEKTMREDLTVKAIPTYNVSNTTGGTTFYIATMDE